MLYFPIAHFCRTSFIFLRDQAFVSYCFFLLPIESLYFFISPHVLFIRILYLRVQVLFAICVRLLFPRRRFLFLYVSNRFKNFCNNMRLMLLLMWRPMVFICFFALCIFLVVVQTFDVVPLLYSIFGAAVQLCWFSALVSG